MRFVEYLAERGIDPGDSPAQLTRVVALDFIPWLARQRYRRGQDSPEQPLSMRSRQQSICTNLEEASHFQLWVRRGVTLN